MRNSSPISTNLDQANSIAQMFLETARSQANVDLYSQSLIDPNTGTRWWRSVTYGQVRERVIKIAGFLETLGIQPGDRIAILSQTRPEWLEADLAILAVGGVVVSIYPTLPEKDIGFILFDSGAKAIFVENDEQIEKVRVLLDGPLEIPATEDRSATSGLLSLKHFFSFEELTNQDQVVSLKEILTFSLGFRGDFSSIMRDSIASLVYTSGTTGPAKGVIQTHGNHLSNVRQVVNSGLLAEVRSLMLFLPLAHSFARLMGYVGLLSNPSLKFPAIPSKSSSKVDVSSVTRDIRECSAEVVPIVPRILEKMMEGIEAAGKGRGLMAILVRACVHSAGIVYQAKVSSVPVQTKDWIKYVLTTPLRVLVRRRLFGPSFRYGVSGGAKLNPAVARFFDGLNIEILEGYGLTETCVATNANRPGKKKIGTVGPVLDVDIELKIAEDSEILFRGPNVAQGYLNRPTATKAAWDSEGWFHTGDCGLVDSEGYLAITGRKKELIVTSYGKKIAPELVEDRIKTSEYISQAVLVGDGRAYCVALLTLNRVAIKNWALARKLTLEPDFSQHGAVLSLLDQELARINKQLASFETVKKFAVIADEFTVENGLLTPTFKVKRGLVASKYAEVIDRLYGDSA